MVIGKVDTPEQNLRCHNSLKYYMNIERCGNIISHGSWLCVCVCVRSRAHGRYSPEVYNLQHKITQSKEGKRGSTGGVNLTNVLRLGPANKLNIKQISLLWCESKLMKYSCLTVDTRARAHTHTHTHAHTHTHIYIYI